MTAIVELIFSVIDLLKAELEQSRQSVARLAMALLLIAGGVLFLVLAIVLLLGALFLALVQVMPTAAAAVLTGVACLIVAGVLVWLGTYKARG